MKTTEGFKNAIDEILKIDTKLVFKTNLGDLGFSNFLPDYEEIAGLLTTLKQSNKKLSDNKEREISSILSTISQKLNNLQSLNESSLKTAGPATIQVLLVAKENLYDLLSKYPFSNTLETKIVVDQTIKKIDKNLSEKLLSNWEYLVFFALLTVIACVIGVFFYNVSQLVIDDLILTKTVLKSLMSGFILFGSISFANLYHQRILLKLHKKDALRSFKEELVNFEIFQDKEYKSKIIKDLSHLLINEKIIHTKQNQTAEYTKALSEIVSQLKK